jgi:soluble lytic murein transglycosylase
VLQPAPPPLKAPELTASDKARAEALDKWIGKKLRGSPSATVKEGCAPTEMQPEAQKNPLCYVLLNAEKLEEKLHPKPEKKPRQPRIRPRFDDGEVTNWDALRADSVNHLIKSFARLGPRKLDIIKAAAIEEKTCPANAAVALAATLEDGLPDDSDIGELGALYEKGGDCLTNPDDKESVLTRAGLFFFVKKDYARAAAIFGRSAAVEAAKSPRPFYWQYRAQLESGDKSGASATLDRLKTRFPFSFHTVMGRLREKQDPDDVLGRSAPHSSPRSSKSPTANLMVEAAERLEQAGFPKSAQKVLDWAVAEAAGSEPEFRLRLAELKAKGNELRPAILVLSQILLDNPEFVSRDTLSLYFPKAFLPLFEKHAGGLDPYLLLSVARQESAFDPRALSSAKAKGLLQLLPNRIRRKKFGKDLFDPETNVRAGSALLAQILDENEKKVYLALSGYNAGPRRIGEWTKRYPVTDPILFIDLIPYKETRAYVALILRNYYWYRRLHAPSDERLPWAAVDARERARWPGAPELATSANVGPASAK